MKVVDKELKKEMKPVVALEAEDVRMPYWITSDKQELIF